MARVVILCHTLDCGDGVVRFVLYDLNRPQVPSSIQLDHVEVLGLDAHDGFTLPLDNLLSKGLFVLYDLNRPQVPSIQLDHVEVLGLDAHDGFTLPLDNLLSKGLRTPKCHLRSNLSVILLLSVNTKEEYCVSIAMSFDLGICLRHLVSKVNVAMIGHYFDGYLYDLQFGVSVSGRCEAILHAVNRLIKDRGDDVGLSMLLVDFKNALNLVD
ncbi:hypothetical protein Tco_0835408 [Tanacetum coccineum]